MTDGNRSDVIRDTGSKAIAAVVGASVGGVPGAVVAVALEPVFLRLAEESWRELGEGRRRSAGLLMQETSATLGGEPEDVTRRAFESPRKAQLLADALQAAVATSHEKKVKALGRALAAGIAGDEARVDEEAIVVAGLASLEAAHIRALVNLPEQRPRPTGTPTPAARGVGGRRGVRAAVLAERSGLSVESATSVLAELVRTGMASRDTYGPERRHDRLLLELQKEVEKLQWMVSNPGKKPASNRRPGTLKKPGPPIEAGYERTPFGELCLTYLELVPDEEQVLRAEESREEPEF